MPFPLAHPVAVLPLRRFCPTWLNLAALMIGSITPDLGYSFRHSEFQDFTHSFWGSLVFCLPLGFLALQAVLFIREPLAQTLPNPHRDALLPLCRTPRSSLGRQAASVLIGAWTHIVLDALTHESALQARQVGALTGTVATVESTGLKFYQVIWILVSLGGLVVMALAYWRHVRKTTGAKGLLDPTDIRRVLLWTAILLVPYIVVAPFVFTPDWQGRRLTKHSLYASLQPYLILVTALIGVLGVALRLRHAHPGDGFSPPETKSSSDTPVPRG